MRECRRQDREGGHDQQIGGQRRPAEHRHAHVQHAGRAHLQNGGDQVDAGQQGADAGDLQRPKIIVDAHPGRELQFRERRVRQPAGSREFAHDERDVDQQGAGGSQPEADGVQDGKRYVPHAQLQRHREIHQPDHERHRHEEDHDGAMRRKDLVVVLGRQIAARMPAASACCERIMMASVKPRSSSTSAIRMYITPMRLWSTLVSHSRHRYGHQR